jgi:hypothetical protein
MRLLFAVILLTITTACAAGQSADHPIYFNTDGTGFSATGKWEPSDPKDKLAYPTESLIGCDRNQRQCVQSTAEYYYGHSHASLDFFHIDKWDQNSIIASSSDSICMTQTIVISFGDKTLTQTYSIKPMTNEKKDACKTFGAEGTRVEVFVLKNSKRWLDDQAANRN